MTVLNSKANLPEQDSISSRELLTKEALLALFALVWLIFLAALFTPEIGLDAASGVAAAHWRAPWIFASVQELLRFLPPFWGGAFLPILILMIWALLPVWDKRLDLEGIFAPAGRRLWWLLLLVSLLFIFILTIKGTYF